MRVSAVIRAHPKRRDLVDELLATLDRPAEVVWDRRNDEWDTGVRAWQAVDPDADYGLVIEDDAIVCRDLLAGLEKALEHVPAESVVSLYLGNRRPYQHRVKQMVTDANSADVSWIRTTSLIWGVAIAVPVSTIADMLTWCEWNEHPNYDARVARYYATVLRWPTYYTWPSLVDHRQVPSLLNHPGERHAHRFVGEDASALDVDWSRQVLTVDGPNRPVRRARPPSPVREMETVMSDILVAKTNAVLTYEGKRVLLRRGETHVRVGHPIVKGHEHLFEPMRVHYDVEQATAAPGEKRNLQLPGEPKPADVRAWAREQGIEVPARGKLPDEVVEQYKAASREA